MKKIYQIVAFLTLLLILVLTAIPALAMDDPVTTTTTVTVVSVDWGTILSGVVYWALRAALLFVCGVVVYALTKYAIPMLPVWVQWLADKRLLWLAKILVNAAEVTLGRFTGTQKWNTVCEWFEARGITVTDDVKQMIYNAWQELNNEMIELGLKDVTDAETTMDGTIDDGSDSTSDTANSTETSAESTGVFAGTDAPVQIE